MILNLIKKTMGKKEKAKWKHFGDILSSGNSVPQGWFSRKMLGKWMNNGLVRYVRYWEDSVEVAANSRICEWNASEIVATEKGLELL